MEVGETALGPAVAMVSNSALTRLSHFEFCIGFRQLNMDSVINGFKTVASHVSRSSSYVRGAKSGHVMREVIESRIIRR